ncbi:MAG: SurA N-terminal domain-containing protein [Prolixibacteraceae bacterium]|jgi:peptidyl-prolyl cis-trans isomerase D|nr:SurA N-terminal domain-containing protein [Prolixibacteraceae bacterium]
MATLQKIRNRAGILVAIIIGLALVAFILGDMLQTGSTLMRPSQLEVAEINGESVQYPDFQRKIEELSEVYKMNMGVSQLDENAWNQVREQVWQTVLRELVMTEVYEEIGVDVSSEELFDLIQGANPHPIVQQIFRNPNTGAFDKDFAVSFLKSLQTNASPQQKMYWLYVENQIKTEKIQEKYSNLISKGLYVTSAEATKSMDEKNKKVNFQYIPLTYSSIADSAVSVSEKELKAYYQAHQDEYKQDKSRRVEYITFEVKASEADDAEAKKWIEDIQPEFARAQDNAQFVNVNSDSRFDGLFLKQEQLSAELGSFAFNGNVGDVFGPYKESESYKLAKIDEFSMLPDSVIASHILIRPESVGGTTAAQQLADSLKNLLDNGANFAELARKYSEDPGSAAKGGDLGWFGRNMMVKPFEDAAFSGELNKVYLANTQFGIHLVKPTKKGKETKHARLAIVERKVTPGTQTYQQYYTQASKFASENQDYESFKKAVIAQQLDKKTASMGENDRDVPGLETSRGLIRAAYQAEVGDILVNNEGSTIFEFGNKFVIAALVNAIEEGVAPFDEVKLRVDLAVRKEKKADMLIAKAKEATASGSNFEAIAQKLGSPVKDAANITFTSYSIPEMGLEPAVIGTVASLPENKVSAPVKGISGVYLLKVISVSEGTDKDVPGEQIRLAQSLGYRVNYQAFEIHRKATEVEDKRSKFY